MEEQEGKEVEEAPVEKQESEEEEDDEKQQMKKKGRAEGKGREGDLRKGGWKTS